MSRGLSTYTTARPAPKRDEFPLKSRRASIKLSLAAAVPEATGCRDGSGNYGGSGHVWAATRYLT